ALEEKGLKVTTEEEYNDSVKEGYVISQSPQANSDVEKETTVHLVVSLGKEEIPPENDEFTFTVAFNPPEDEDGEEAEKKMVTIYVEDMNNSIQDVYEEKEITKDTDFKIPVVIEEDKTAEIKVLRDEELVFDDKRDFKGGN